MQNGDDTYSEAKTKRRSEAAINRMLATPPKHHTPKGKPSRAQSRKSKPVRPAKQRVQRLRGR
jgi:hypothetical protein